MDRPRTLPLRVPLGDGEALDSWLLRLAHRNGVPLLRLGAVLGFGDRLWVPRNYALTKDLPAALLRRIEAQTGLAPSALDGAMLDQYHALGWKPIPGSRYCPACLTDTGGRWPIRWQLPFTFVCLAHRCLLAVLCPQCRRTPRSHLSARSGLAGPTRCTLGASRHGTACDGDLLTHQPQHLDRADTRLRAQRWINQRLDRMDTAAAVTDLRDLDTLVTWFRHRVEPAELAYLGPDTVTALTTHRGGAHQIRLHQPTAAFIAAAMSCQAIAMITADERRRRRLVAPLLRGEYFQYRTGQTPSPRGPMILSHKRLARLSPPLQRNVLLAFDSHLQISERLRNRTCTATPRLPTPGAGCDRARHVPQYLWPDWIIRFLPVRGAHTDDLAVDIANALLIPGNPARNRHATDELTPWRNNTSIFLSETAQRFPDVLTAICALAEHLDTHGAPIDYRRRRAVFTDIDLPTDTWHDLCYQAGIDPGKGTRVLQARRYLFQLLTGANLADSRHHLAFTGNTDRTYYVTRFGRLLDTTFRQVLHDHAANLLVDAGIDEPVTWSPPAGCITGLRLPGREPADIDLTALKQLLDGERVSTTVAARRLHVSIDHLRHVEHHLDRPPPALHKSSTTTARRVREQASALLTRDFFQRDYLDAGTTLRTLAARIGLPHLIVVQHARSYGIPVNNRSKKTATATDPVAKPRRPRIVLQPKPRPKVIRPPRVDPDWLREQTETLHRTNGNIGTDVGLSHEAIRRHRARLGLSNRPSGSAGHTVHTRRHPDLPADIRHAAEGKRHGWQRLRRFQQLAAHPSINAAAHALGLYQQNLFLQLDRLEHDIGTKLIDRTNNRYQPMQLTRRGRLLLELLDTVEVRQLLDRYAPESTSPPPQH